MVNGIARPTEEWRIKPAYTIQQASWLANVSTATVRRWLYGYEQPGHQMQPVFGNRDTNAVYLSFLEVAEMVVVAAFRRHNKKLERIRRAWGYARHALGIEYPFATLKMKEFGLHIVTDFQEAEPGASLLVLDAQGQLTLPGAVGTALESFDWLNEWASRWYPGGKEVPIVVDPQMAAGRPTVEGRGITIDTIMRRFWRGQQDPPLIAEDLELDLPQIYNIIRYATDHRQLVAA